MATSKTAAIAPVSRADYEKHLEEANKAREEARRAEKLDAAKKTVDTYQGRLDDAKTLAEALRGVIVTHADNEHVSLVKNALSSVQSHGQDAKYYRDDAVKTVARLEGAAPVDDEDLI